MYAARNLQKMYKFGRNFAVFRVLVCITWSCNVWRALSTLLNSSFVLTRV